MVGDSKKSKAVLHPQKNKTRAHLGAGAKIV